MLLANRRERGKKKLADRWESTIYTVVGVNAETHTYRICDTTSGQEKVIHRNLLMLVNFLPVGDTCEGPDLGSSVPLTESSTPNPGSGGMGEAEVALLERGSETLSGPSGSLDAGSVSNSPVTDPEPVDSERRTIEWITQLTVPSLSEADVTDLTSETSDPLAASNVPGGDRADLSGTCGSSSVTVVDVSVIVRQPDSNPDTMIQTDNAGALLALDQTSSTLCDQSDVQTQARSRFGRLVRPVNRLIQTMSRQDVVQDKFNVRAVCRSVFQAFAD